MSTEESSTTGASAGTEKSNQSGEPTAETQAPIADAAADNVAATEEEMSETMALDLSPEQLAELLREAKFEAKTNWDNALRAQAELENLRKRAQRDVENAHKYGLERFLEELLPIRDSMELGLSAALEEGVDSSSVRAGVELTLKMLIGVMDKFGIEEVNPMAAAFDPEFHQAMSMQEVDGVESGTVTMVMQKGYVLNGRLVRPALVMVAK